MLNSFEWTDEIVRQIVDRARESRQRAETMRAHCARMQRMTLMQQQRLRDVASRLTGRGPHSS